MKPDYWGDPVQDQLGEDESPQNYYLPRGHTSSKKGEKSTIGLVWRGPDGKYGLKTGSNRGFIGVARGGGEFHDELEDAFNNNVPDIDKYFDALIEVVDKYVWNGDAPDEPVHPMVESHGELITDTSSFASEQAGQYQAILQEIDRVRQAASQL